MSVNIQQLKQCRACDSHKVKKVIDFAETGIADDYFKEKDNSAKYPLVCLLCKDCGLLQLEYVVDASAIYDEYIYVSSSSPGLDKHFEQYADQVDSVLSLTEHSKVLDIGCNDGMLLKHFEAKGCQVNGVEPAKPIAQALNEYGIKTYNGYWHPQAAKEVEQAFGKFDLVTSNNVFANVNNIQEFAGSVRQILSEQGVWVVETGYHYSLIDNFVFDNIYHEHLSYFSVTTLQTFFKKMGMKLFHVEKVESKGGSIRVFACLDSCNREVIPSVAKYIQLENDRNLFEASTYQAYTDKIASLKTQLHDTLTALKQQGKTIVGFGASATTTTVMHVFDIAQYFDYLVDDNPIKHGTFSPGFRVPVRPTEYLEQGTCVVILPWRFADMFIEKNENHFKCGGSFLKVMPEIELIGA